MFRFNSYGSSIVARWLLLLGLGLIGLGILVFIFREILAALAAVILIAGGFGMSLTAARIYWNQRHSRISGEEEAYRKNVRIRGMGDGGC